MNGQGRNGWVWPAVAIAAAVTLARVVLLAFNRTDLFVDEAQYWLWSQEPALGYYSKPPLIAWVIGVSTGIGGDTAFWIRLPAPLIHGVTAVLLGAVAARVAGSRAAVLVAAAWVTLPMVAVGSLLISTDTVMVPFLVLALLAYLACLDGAGRGVALAGGLALGVAFLGKYAAVYFLLCAALAAVLVPLPRLGWGRALAFLAGFLIAASPNVAWNLANGLTTVEHTLDNAAWVRDAGGSGVRLNPQGLAAFLVAQFVVVGPVIFGGLLWLGATWARRFASTRRLLVFSLPILALVSVQALLSHAYANWAAAAYVAGTVAVVPWLPRQWIVASFLVNGAIALLLPVASILGPDLTWQGRPVLERYLGRVEMSETVMAAARADGLETIVASDRDVLGDLFHTGRDSGLAFRAIPTAGRAPHHYALRYPFTGEGPVLLVLRATESVPCEGAVPLGPIAPLSGAYRTRPMTLWRVDGACLRPG